MRLITSNSSLFVISSLFLLSTSLPFEPRNFVWVEHLVRRATYSVVAVDGGAAATSKGSSPEGASTIVETIVQTQAPTTKTIIETDNLPPVTDVVISTQTIEGPDTTQTLLVTVTPSPATVTTSGYSIIDVSAPTVTIEVPQPLTTEISSSSSTFSAAKSSSSSAEPQTSSAISLSPSSTISSPTSSADSATAVSTFSTSSVITFSNKSVSSTSVSTSVSISASNTSYTSSKSSTSSLLSYTSTSTLSSTSILSATSTSTALNTPYDNGQWHTTYPSRSNATRTAAPSAVQATSLPTLEHSSPVAKFTDSVPGMP